MSNLRFPIRLKLIIGSLAPLFVAILICSLAGAYLITTRIDAMAQQKVRTDLNVAREVYSNQIAHLRDVVRFSADMPFAGQAVTAHDRVRIAPLITSLRHKENLDILTIVDSAGVVLYRAGNPDYFGDRRGDDPLVARALAGQVTAGSQILPPERLKAEGSNLAERAAIAVISTKRSRTVNKGSEKAGMMMVASAPVKDQEGNIVGALYGGVLLNRNNAVVDRIKRIVFEGVTFEGKDMGTATIFLDDTRISTNVQTGDGRRAIGTRLSAEVYERVVTKGEKWVDRAFVVNGWYFSAYEPINDFEGKVIGSLYVGMQEQPSNALKNHVHLLFGGILLVGSLFGLAMSGMIGNHLSWPILELQRIVKRFSAGERELSIEATTSDEIGELAREFNTMTITLKQREEAINELNQGLEEKVRERTAELEAKNLQLVKTQEDLLRAEKLAAIGELAAGVAHEINNPMAIIRGNAEVLLMALKPEHPNREEAEIISRQVGRVDEIVSGLLTFARQQVRTGCRVALEPILDDILRQVGHQVPLNGISIFREFALGNTMVEGEGNQLRQVFTNLIVNALQAMPDGGELTVRTSPDPADNTCQVMIIDTGNGIPPEQLRDIFTPFFTTRQSGTGLGLSISYGILKYLGGAIEVQSEPGRGASFIVTLPL